MSDREWMLNAECRGYPYETFFPTPAETATQTFAQTICIEDCPVFQQCSKYRREMRPTAGVWAGEYINETRNPTPSLAGVLKPCGTEAAYQRHLRANENPCGPCLRAHQRYNIDTNTRRKAKR